MSSLKKIVSRAVQTSFASAPVASDVPVVVEVPVVPVPVVVEVPVVPVPVVVEVPEVPEAPTSAQ